MPINPKRALIWTILIGLCFATASMGAGETSHSDPIAAVLLALIIILASAKIAGELSERLGMPAVLGELAGGIVLGNMVLINPAWSFFEPLRVAPLEAQWAVVIDGLAELGVLILLFEVGLESTVRGMMKVGASSFLVAILGVVAPFILGYGVSWAFISELPPQLAAIVPAGFSLSYVHLFIGAVLCATSVGITARVFQDLGRLRSNEAQIILGAAVIDDVLGLIILAVVSGVITAAELGRPPQAGSVLVLIGAAVLFVVGSLAIGIFLVPKVMRQLAKLRTSGIMLTASLLFAFALSYLASRVGLAAIVGAFAAGLLLEQVHFTGFREEIDIFKLIKPISTILVPIFFVLMGIQVRLETFANLAVLGVAAGLTAAAIAGKQVCGLGAFAAGLDRVSIGIGMVPRGEVGLIFAGIGRDLKIVDDAIFTAIVIMVIATTLITPPLLKASLARWERKS